MKVKILNTHKEDDVNKTLSRLEAVGHKIISVQAFGNGYQVRSGFYKMEKVVICYEPCRVDLKVFRDRQRKIDRGYM